LKATAVNVGFAKTILLLAGVCVISVAFARAQLAISARPQFEVASITRSAACGPRDNIYGALLSSSTGRLTLICATVAGLILGAYGRYALGYTSFSLPPPVLGGPSWINSERYTIKAEAAGRENRAMMNGPMLQALLEDRLKLKLHRQTRQVPVFALTVTKSGARLKPFQEGTCAPVDYGQDPPPPAPGQPPLCQNGSEARAQI
jgi:uncharacterized protein (TIGR03435 family)